MGIECHEVDRTTDLTVVDGYAIIAFLAKALTELDCFFYGVELGRFQPL